MVIQENNDIMISFVCLLEFYQNTKKYLVYCRYMENYSY